LRRAGYLHLKETVAANAGWQAATGEPLVYKDPDDALALYVQATSALNPTGGYQPGDQTTDCGLVLVDFLNWQMRRGDILAHAVVDFKNDQLLRLSRWLFGGIYWAFNLPPRHNR